MNPKNIILFKLYLLLFLHTNIISKENINYENTDINIKEKYNSLIQWAEANYFLNISSKINLEFISEKKYFIAKRNISRGEILIDIPFNLTINLNTLFSFYNKTQKNINKKYEKYLNKGKTSEQMLNDISYMEQSFMAFLLYNINLDKNELNQKFKEKYKYLDYLFKEDLSHLPSSFTDEQINTFVNASFYTFFNLMNNYLAQEIEILQKEIFKEKINLDNYFKYRFILLQKSLNISNKTTIIPFIDLIKRDFNNAIVNTKLVVNKGSIKLKAIKDIKKDESLILKLRKMSNQYSFIFYGKTYEELINYMPSFIIPMITPDLLRDEGIKLDIENNEEDNQIDLAWDNLYEYILPTYKEVLKLLKKDDNDYNCYEIFLKYLILIRDAIKSNKIEELDEVFDYEEDEENVKRIIKGEIIFLNKKIKEIENIMEKSKNKNKNKTLKAKKNNNNKEKNKIEDL